MFDVKSVNDVVEIINSNFSGYDLTFEKVHIKNAVGRITAVDILSNEDIPGFNRSSVDGYAVISSDTFGASDSMPAQLQLIGEVKMGEKPQLSISKGQAVYVPTGGGLPENADAMVMIEYTENFEDGYIYINKASAPANNMVYKGDDTKVGNVVIRADRILRAQDIGALAAMGYEEILLKRKIKVGIISTGDEIIDISEKPTGSKVRDINSYALYAGIASFGCEPILYGIINDDFEKIRQTAKQALLECDVVLMSGGSSVGFKDETFKVINSLGEPGVLVHGIAVKPGKPTIIGKIQGKAVIGLPGHPASAFMIFKFVVCRIFDVMNGAGNKYLKGVSCEMKYNYPSNTGREEFLPVQLEENDGKIFVHPVFGKSGLITILTSADGYVHISRGSEGIAAGEKVEVVLF